MNAAKKPAKPKLAVINGLVTTTSLAVAEHFGKAPGEVLREIFGMVEFSKKNLGEDFHARNYRLPDDDCADVYGTAMCRMTRSGFELWFTHFGGRDRKARAAAVAYMEAFEMMERSLSLPTVGNVLQFEGTRFEIVDREGVPWLRGQQIAVALGYKRHDILNQLYQANADEFTDGMTALVKMPTAGGMQDVRIFSPRGCYALAMFARTEKAKAFRRWVLDVLEGKAPSPSQPMDAHPFTNEVAFLRLFYAFDHNLGPAVLLWCLMQMGATSRWISPSVRDIADESNGMISKSNVTRCAVNLKERGLIDMKADLPWARAAYYVFEEAVAKLLQEAGKRLAGLPGIQEDGDGPLLLGLANGTVH